MNKSLSILAMFWQGSSDHIGSLSRLEFDLLGVNHVLNLVFQRPTILSIVPRASGMISTPRIWVLIVSTSACRRFIRLSLSSSGLFLTKVPMRSVLNSSCPLDRLRKISLNWVSRARKSWLSCWEAIAEINSEEGKWPVIRVPVMQWWVCMHAMFSRISQGKQENC